MTIVEFIEARIAEDEATARAAIDPDRPGTHWCWEDGERDPLQPGVEVEGLDTQAISLRTVEEYPTLVHPLPAFVLRQVEARQQGALWHIARHDPGRELREVVLKRRILDRHKPIETPTSGQACVACSFLPSPHVGDLPDYVAWPCAEMRDLAAIWSDHPDFRAELSA